MGVPKHGKNKGLRYTARFLLKKYELLNLYPDLPPLDAGFEMVVAVGFGQTKRMFVNYRATSEGDVRNRIVTGNIRFTAKF